MARTRTYHQLSLDERDIIACWRAKGLCISEIARRLKRNKGTISRELRRNKAPVYDAYGAARAHREARARKRKAGHRPRLKNATIRSFVERRLRLGWTPEQIVGSLRQRHNGQSVCIESIYRFIYDPRVRCQENFVPYLVRAHKKRWQRTHRHTHRDLHIPERISIRERPKAVQSRREFGHWESDTVIARHSHSALNVMVERKSRLTKIHKLKYRTAKHLRMSITRSLSKYPKAVRKSITYDNGPDNVEHTIVNAILGTRSYFCEPFHSWEKGTVENTIGIIRRTFPKKTNIDAISVLELKRLENRMNNRPRKVLHYKTPRAVFNLGVALAC